MKISITIFFCVYLSLWGDTVEEHLKELDSAFERCKGTFAEYPARRGKTWFVRSAFYFLEPTLIRPALLRQVADRVEADKRIRKILDDVRLGFSWRSPPAEIHVPYTPVTPEIDGQISPLEWKYALVWKGGIPLNKEWQPNDENIFWYVMYDRENLYVSASFEGNDFQIDKKEPYKGDSFELFLMGDPDMQSYWEIVVSPENDRFTGWHMAGKYGERCSRPGIAPHALRTAATKTPSGFSVEIAFPLSALSSLKGAFPFPAGEFRFMMLRTAVEKNSRIRVCVPVPFLYDGHNIYGYMKATFNKQKEN